MTKTISAIWIQDLNGGIGYQNKLLAHIPKDLQRFKTVTLEKVCIMGSKTFESILEYNNKPLPNRHTIVLSKTKNYDSYDNVTTYNCFPSVMGDIRNNSYPFSTTDEVVVCGGSEMYYLFKHKINKIYKTVILNKFDNVDSYIESNLGNQFTLNSFELIKKDKNNKYDIHFITKEKEMVKHE